MKKLLFINKLQIVKSCKEKNVLRQLYLMAHVVRKK